MEHDLNGYDLEHVCTSHPLMSNEEWLETYKKVWAQY